jgi:hypothetical protein
MNDPSSAARTITPTRDRTGAGATTSWSRVRLPGSLRAASLYDDRGGNTLSAASAWRVRDEGAARAVDFLVGELLWSDSRKPFAFAAVTAGTRRASRTAHMLTAGHGHGRTWKRWTVRVVTMTLPHDIELRPAEGLGPGGSARMCAAQTAWPLRDGKVISRPRGAVHSALNSHRVADGRHRVLRSPPSLDGRIPKRTLPLVVSNRAHRTPLRGRSRNRSPSRYPRRRSSRRPSSTARRSAASSTGARTSGRSHASSSSSTGLSLRRRRVSPGAGRGTRAPSHRAPTCSRSARSRKMDASPRRPPSA